MLPPAVVETPVELVASDGVRLSGMASAPPEGGGRAVVCHPHPLMGGNMDNKVVLACVRAAAGAGWGTVRFDFRGVRSSGGTYDGGEAERLDVDAALTYGGRGERVLVGYSFGAMVAAAALSHGARVSRLALIGVPLGMWQIEPPPLPPQGLVVVVGDRDEHCDVTAASAFVSSYQDPRARLVVVERADHLFHARLEPLVQSVRDALV